MKSEPKTDQARRLRLAIETGGFPSVAAFARYIGHKNDSTVRHHANGTRPFGFLTASRYAEALGISPVVLFVGKDKLEPELADFIDMASQLSPAERQAVQNLIETMRRGRAS